MIIGANDNTFLQRGSQFDVMRNVEGGIEDAGGWLLVRGGVGAWEGCEFLDL